MARGQRDGEAAAVQAASLAAAEPAVEVTAVAVKAAAAAVVVKVACMVAGAAMAAGEAMVVVTAALAAMAAMERSEARVAALPDTPNCRRSRTSRLRLAGLCFAGDTAHSSCLYACSTRMVRQSDRCRRCHCQPMVGSSRGRVVRYSHRSHPSKNQSWPRTRMRAVAEVAAVATAVEVAMAAQAAMAVRAVGGWDRSSRRSARTRRGPEAVGTG